MRLSYRSKAELLIKRELLNKFANYIGGSASHLVLSGLSYSQDKVL
jgi:hypothetical protein